jgi:hypothetical protein
MTITFHANPFPSRVDETADLSSASVGHGSDGSVAPDGRTVPMSPVSCHRRPLGSLAFLVVAVALSLDTGVVRSTVPPVLGRAFPEDRATRGAWLRGQADLVRRWLEQGKPAEPKSARISDTYTTTSHFSASRLEVLEAVVPAAVGEE